MNELSRKTLQKKLSSLEDYAERLAARIEDAKQELAGTEEDLAEVYADINALRMDLEVTIPVYTDERGCVHYG